jgi:isopentenyl diphosphate isomerase/L-lactate dehydrogenase-like FMN-dependent dehydrogenase
MDQSDPRSDPRLDPRTAAVGAARELFEWLRTSPLADVARQAAESFVERSEPGTAGEEWGTLAEVERAAHRRLGAQAREYLEGGADDGRTVRRNREALERLAIRPRRLVDVSRIDTTQTLFGEALSSPLLLAPIGFQGLLHPEGELATARAAARTGHRLVVSTVANHGVEAIAAAAGGAAWFQLYPTDDRRLTAALLERAERAGCRVCLITVDTPVFGRREQGGATLERLLAEAPLGNFEGLGRPLSFVDPSLEWDFLPWLRQHTSMALVPKGIVTAEDARLCLEHGADGLVVSNHGGRQLGAERGSADCLPEVVEAVGGRVPVLFDGGLRRGTDLFCALALGADAVLVGRPYAQGLAAGGADGVARVLELLQAELVHTLRLCGTPTLRHVVRACVAT